MNDAQVCSYCGAPIQHLVAGRCPHCNTVIDRLQSDGLIIDARGPIWRLVVLGVPDKAKKKVIKYLSGLDDWSKDRAKSFVDSVQPNQPQALMENVGGMATTPVFTELLMLGCEVSEERREGGNWVVTANNETIRKFWADQGGPPKGMKLP